MAKKRFNIGDAVGVLLGGVVVRAIIIEDRGNLGPGNSRIVRVETTPTENDAVDVARFEVPETALVGV